MTTMMHKMALTDPHDTHKGILYMILNFNHNQ